MTKRSIVWAVAAMLAAGAHSASIFIDFNDAYNYVCGNQIAVANHSFEDDGLANGAWSAPPSAWSVGGTGVSGVINPTSTQANEATVDGDNVAFAASDSYLVQALSTNFVEGATYTLRVGVARRKDHGTVANWRIVLQYDSTGAGGWLDAASLTGTIDSSDDLGADGTLFDRNLVYTADASVNGREIRIVLRSDASSVAQALFDNVRLENDLNPCVMPKLVLGNHMPTFLYSGKHTVETNGPATVPHPWFMNMFGRSQGPQYPDAPTYNSVSAPLFSPDWVKEASAPWLVGATNINEASVKKEIEDAIAAGLDGFTFWYGGLPEVDGQWPPPPETIQPQLPAIDLYFEVAEEHFPNFKLTLMLGQPLLQIGARANNAAEAELVRRRTMEQFLDRHADSPNLLLSPDGRIVFTSHLGAHLGYVTTDPGSDVAILALQQGVVQRWRNIFSSLEADYGKGIYFIADMPSYAELSYGQWSMSAANFDILLDMWGAAFDGLSVFAAAQAIDGDTTPYYMDLADAAHTNGTAFVCPFYWGFMARFNAGEDAVLMNGFDRLMNSWDLVNQTDADTIQVITWNDYTETSGFAPTIGRNFAMQQLLKIVGDAYEAGTTNLADAVEEDTLFLAYRRYPEDVPVPAPPYPIMGPWHENLVALDADEIQVLVFAEGPSDLTVNSYAPVAVGSGMTLVSQPLETGNPSASLERSSTVVAEATGLAKVIDGTFGDAPYRCLLDTYMISSNFEELFEQAFGYAFNSAGTEWVDLNTNDLADWYELIQAGEEYIVMPLGPTTNGHASISVANHSFEDDVLADGAWSPSVSGWGVGGSSSGGAMNPTSAWANEASVDGSNTGFLNADSNLNQEPGVNFVADSTYALTVGVARRKDQPNGNANWAIVLQYDDGAGGWLNAAVLKGWVGNGDPGADGTLVDRQLTYMPAADIVGKAMRIMLRSDGVPQSGDKQVLFDNVRLKRSL